MLVFFAAIFFRYEGTMALFTETNIMHRLILAVSADSCPIKVT